MKSRGLVAFVVCAAFLCETVFAADLDNNDRKRYEVKIRSGTGATTNSWIEGNTIQKGVCSNCEIVVVGVGAIKVSGSMTVTIKDGKLSARQ